ncbi:MAG: CBS domain-containing protein [Gemmatimonadota bacterium]
MQQTCREIMTKTPACIEPGATVEQVALLMKQRNVGSVPVVESLDTMVLVGIITDRDLAIKVIAERRDPGEARVGEIMTANPIVCAPEDEIQRALETMARQQVRRLPVVEQRRVIGIIAQADIATRLNAPADTATLVEQISREWKDM